MVNGKKGNMTTHVLYFKVVWFYKEAEFWSKSMEWVIRLWLPPNKGGNTQEFLYCNAKLKRCKQFEVYKKKACFKLEYLLCLDYLIPEG